MKLRKWKDIKEQFCHNLLLGNGASIAIDERFIYESLYEMACAKGLLGKNLQNLFRRFKTKDFEFSLRLLRNASRVNKSLRIEERKTGRAYNDLKDALINVIRMIHPTYEEVETGLVTVTTFMKPFKKVMSLSYDLMVYWAMLKGNDIENNAPRFKDCFIEGEFKSDWKHLQKPYGSASGTTLVFYPHGNLVLATDVFGDEIKLHAADRAYLLDSVLTEWEQGEHIPLFVSEGDTNDKLRAIHRSNYLDTVYDTVLSRLDESLVIYGWSFGEQDEHILSAIAKGDVKRVAVSVYARGDSDAQDFCDMVRSKIRKLGVKPKNIAFFDAESPGCWAHC